MVDIFSSWSSRYIFIFNANRPKSFKKKKNSRLLVGVDGSRANVLQPHESSPLAISPIYELWKPNPKAKKIKKSKSILV